MGCGLMDVGQVVAGRYRLTERLGGGGMGVVWKAHDERLRRTVAVKEVLLPPGLEESRLEEIRRRTMREGRIAAKLHHPQLITVYDVIEDDGKPYLIMEYLPSQSLSRLLADHGLLDPVEAARIGSQAAAALAAAHTAGVVHRDVTAGNILVGDSDTVKITDFGVSRVVEDVTGATTGAFVGTPAYLAPEVAQGKKATFASDVYSLGAALYSAVEGTPPAGRNDNPIALLHRIASGEVVPPKRAGPLTGVLMRLLSADPEQRPTMAAARTALAEVAAGVAPAAAPAATVPAPVPAVAPVAAPADDQPRRRLAGILLAVTCVLVAAAVATTLLLINNNEETPGNNAGAGSSTSESTANDTPTGEPTEPTEPSTTSSRQTTTPSVPSSSSNAIPPPADPGAAVSGYYALMPGNPDEGFTRLSARFQQSPAGGPAKYRTFWGGIESVAVSELAVQGATVDVTVRYVYKDGRRFVERHRYQLIQQDGRWLIDAVSVLSSTSDS